MIFYVVYNQYGYIGLRKSLLGACALRHHYVEQEFYSREKWDQEFDDILPLNPFDDELYMTRIMEEDEQLLC